MLFRHETRKSFLADAPSPELEAEVGDFIVSPAGPIIGPGMPQAAGKVLIREREAFQAVGMQEDALDDLEFDFKGTRRPYRIRLENAELDSGFDEHGPYVRVAFDLPRGSYATVVLREIIGDDGVEAHRRDRRDRNAFRESS